MSDELVGSLAGLLAAMAWAANGLLIRAHGAGLHAVAINAMRCTIASVFFASHLAIRFERRGRCRRRPGSS